MTIETIYRICSREYRLNLKDKSRKGKLPEGRATFYFYAKKYYPTITHGKLGKITGGRDHSTVTQALKRLNETYINDKAFKKIHDHIGKILEKIEDSQPTIKEEETQEQYEIRLLRKQIRENEREIDRLRRKTDVKFNNEIKRMLSQIPEHKINDFKETRLKPYLKMNSL